MKGVISGYCLWNILQVTLLEKLTVLILIQNLQLLISSWPEAEGDESCSSHFMQVQSNCLSDYAKSLKLFTFVVFLVLVIKNCK